jgi:hypothetical protein
MNKNIFNIPIVFIIFNRPKHTKAVFSEIAKLKPQKLYIIADGARLDNYSDKINCEKSRNVVTSIDWECNVIKIYSEANLGCKNRIVTGLNEVFLKEKYAIILEDDCLPSQDFFYFSEKLLLHYENNKSIGMISGCNFNEVNSEYSYYFSRYSHIWGWATWSRAWSMYDHKILSWPQNRNSDLLNSVIQRQGSIDYWMTALDGVFNNKIDTWDYQWNYSCWVSGMLSIVPSRNMISNIGFGKDATHTRGISIFSKMKRMEMSKNLKHPSLIEVNKENDYWVERMHFDNRFSIRIYKKILAFINIIKN